MANNVKRGPFFSCKFVYDRADPPRLERIAPYSVVLSRQITFDSLHSDPYNRLRIKGRLTVYGRGPEPVAVGTYYEDTVHTFIEAETFLEKQESKFKLMDYSGIHLDKHDQLYYTGYASIMADLDKPSKPVVYVQVDGALSYGEALEALLEKIASISVTRK